MQSNSLPFSQACENNKHFIIEHIKPWLASTNHVLEIGSGTGQHCDYFTQHLPTVTWQPTDCGDYFNALTQRLKICDQTNLREAKYLDVTAPIPEFANDIDCVFTANTLHIMSKEIVIAFFSVLEQILAQRPKAQLIVYGPFNYSGQFTSDSNQQFDRWLKHNNPQSGIRDIEWIIQLAQQQQLKLVDDVAMPANNRLLRFSK